MRIKNKNDIFAYFEIIRGLEPKSILDVGMFLKRVGSVSRHIMNREVPQEIYLGGIDFFPEVSFAPWDNIYDGICIWQEFFDRSKRKQYELGVILGSDALYERLDTKELFRETRECCDYFFVDCLVGEEIKDIENLRVKDIKVEGDVYYFVDNRR